MQYFSTTKQMVLSTFLLMLGLATISCNAETNEKSAQSFPAFWKVFRDASLNNDVNRILKMTIFPFSVKSELDAGEATVLDAVKFKKQFKLFMEQDIRENLAPESMRDYIMKNKKITPKIYDGQTSVALFSFELINGNWFFVRVYVEK